MVSVVRVVLPRVLAVEDDADHVLAGRAVDELDDVAHVAGEVLRRGLTIPLLVLEPDQVGEAVVAEEQLRAASAEPVTTEQPSAGNPRGCTSGLVHGVGPYSFA